MKLLNIYLVTMVLLFAVSATAEDFNGFRGIAWGTSVEKILESEPKLAEGLMGTMPGVKAFQIRGDDLNLGGVKTESITYIFYKGRFSSVSIDFRGYDSYEKLLAHCKRTIGPVTATAVLRQEQYTGFDSPKTSAMLLYQLSLQTSNFGRLYIYSKEFVEGGSGTSEQEAGPGRDKGAPKGKNAPPKPSPSEKDSTKTDDVKM